MTTLTRWKLSISSTWHSPFIGEGERTPLCQIVLIVEGTELMRTIPNVRETVT